jgi:carbon-monoxide dehydrogenase medium subunit
LEGFPGGIIPLGREKIVTYQFLQPSTLAEATEILNSHEDVRVLAGGTDLLVLLKDRVLTCRYVMDIKKISELNVLCKSENGLEIGGAVSLNKILASDLTGGCYSVLRDGALALANSLLRNRATLIGNICNASPGGDMLPASLVLGGVLEAVSVSGSRLIPLCDFFTGVKKHVLEKNELVTKITFAEKNGKGVYLKKKRIKGHDLAQTGVAAFWTADGMLSVALGAVAPTPVLIAGMGPIGKSALRRAHDGIETEILNRINPISDTRSSREYRIAMVKYFIGEIISLWTEGAHD